jgi:PKD repeat protein
MKIKGCWLVLVFAILSTLPLRAQFINSLQVLPANPTTEDTLLFLANCTFSSMGCATYTQSINVLGNDIYAQAMHCLGMATAMCDYTDTFKVDPLAAGTYRFIYQVDVGFGGPPCTPGIAPGPTDTLAFVVDSFMANCPLPMAAFGYYTSGLAVSFEDSSQTSGSVQYAWTLGDGNTSSLPNPTHTYSGDSTYQVCLTVTDSCGSDTFCTSVSVADTTVACPQPQAGFGYTANYLDVNFSDSSTTNGSVSYSWDLGDGTISLLADPTHSYSVADAYWVCLTVTDSCGTDSICDSIVVMDVPVGIEAGNGLIPESFFPNPSTGELFYGLKGPIQNGAMLILYAITGEKVVSCPINQRYGRLQLGLENGMYLAFLTNGDQRSGPIKLILNQ